MKKLYRILIALLILSFLSTAVIIALSPDVIPAHYNAAGQVDRFGSKYENLIFPGLSLFMTVFFLVVDRFQQKKHALEPERRVLLYASIFSLTLFNGLGLFFGIAAIRYNGNSIGLEARSLIHLVSIGTGGLLIVLGNIMPKIRRNAFFGLRTKWSMSGDNAWRKSQRFGGISAVICGLTMILLSLFVPANWNLVLMTALSLLWVFLGIAASYRFAKEEKNPENSKST